jgi:hypothetical protein
VQRRDHDRLGQAKARKVGQRVLLAALAFGFVGRENDRLARRRAAQQLGHVDVGSGQPGRRVDHPDDHVRLAHGFFSLQPDIGQQIAGAGLQSDTAGVDDRELAIAPLGRAVQTIARGARLIVDHRAVLANQAIE